MAPKWLCFSVAKRLGGVDVVPLIQIKQIRTEVRTVRTRSANGLVPCGERVLSEQLNPMAPHIFHPSTNFGSRRGSCRSRHSC